MRRRRDDGLPRCSHLLEARRQVGGIPDRRVIHPQVVANSPDDYESSVEPQTHLYRRSARVATLVQRTLDIQRCQNGAPGMVLMGNGSPE